MTRAAWPRAWAALAWASLATLTTAVAGGRLGAVVAHVLLPLVAVGFVCAARRSAGFWAVFGGAAALGLTAAFNPLLGVVGACAAIVLFAFGRGATRLRAAVLFLVPIGLLGPWVLRVVEEPLLLLAGPGMTVWQSATAWPWQLALPPPGGPGPHPALLAAPILLAGVVAMARRREVDSTAMNALAALAVTGLALGLVAPQVIIGQVPNGLPGAGDQITVWAGTGLDLMALASIAAALHGFCGLSGRAPGTGRLVPSGVGRAKILVAPVVVAAVLGVVASIAAAAWFGVGSQLARAEPNTPAVAADQAHGILGNRLLVLGRDPDTGSVTYRLVGSEAGPVARDLPAARAVSDPVLAAALRHTVRNVEATNTGGDAASPAGSAAARDSLVDLGVGFVALRGPSNDPLVTRLDSTQGLTRLSDSRGLILWRVTPGENAIGSSRLRLEDARGGLLSPIAMIGSHAQTDVPVGEATGAAVKEGRRLVVAEPARWADHAQVRFAGQDLEVVAGGSQPTYVLPPNAGQLSITVEPSQPWWRWGQLGLLLVVLFLAVPSVSTRPRTTS